MREWAQTLKNEVKLWLVRKLVDFRDPRSVLYEIPDEFKPVFDSKDDLTIIAGIARKMAEVTNDKRYLAITQ